MWTLLLVGCVLLLLAGGCSTEATSGEDVVATPELPSDLPAGASLELGNVCDGVGCNGDQQTRSSDGMELVYVPGGTFRMGSAEGDDDELPVHLVTLDGFWIDRTEVTNARYRQCVEAGNCDEPGCWDDAGFNALEQPVVCVSWWDADDYCEWAGGRLPTEAEWEYAARGPESFLYPWGNTFECAHSNADDESELDDYIVPGGEGCDGYVRTAPVGSFEGGASWCGALDLAGNAWEWVHDWHELYPDGPRTNPIGPEFGNRRVLRGGSWDYYEHSVRAANRRKHDPDYQHENLGFRCVVGAIASRSQ
jgi:formylglycine-generating enzyme required for sulfatase activity